MRTMSSWRARAASAVVVAAVRPTALYLARIRLKCAATVLREMHSSCATVAGDCICTHVRSTSTSRAVRPAGAYNDPWATGLRGRVCRTRKGTTGARAGGAVGRRPGCGDVERLASRALLQAGLR